MFGDNSFKSKSIGRFQCNTDYTCMMNMSSDLGLVRFYCLQNGMAGHGRAWHGKDAIEIQGDNKMHCRVKLGFDK